MGSCLLTSPPYLLRIRGFIMIKLLISLLGLCFVQGNYVPVPQNYANVVNAVPTPFMYTRDGAYGPLGQTDSTERTGYSYIPVPHNYANVVNAVPTPFMYTRAVAYGPLGQTDSTERTGYSYTPVPQNYANVVNAVPTPFMYTRAGAYGPLGQA